MYHLWTRDHRPAFYQDAIGAVSAGNAAMVLKAREEEEKEEEEEKKKMEEKKEEKKEEEEVQDGQPKKVVNEKQEKKLSQQMEKRERNQRDKAIENQKHQQQRVEHLRASSEHQVRSLLYMQGSTPLDATCPIERRYGLGNIRSLADFEKRTGVCFLTLEITALPPPPGVRYCADDVSDALSALSLSLSLSDSNGINGVGSGAGTGLGSGQGLGSGLGIRSESGQLNVPVQPLKSAPAAVRGTPSSGGNALDALNIVRSYLLKNNSPYIS